MEDGVLEFFSHRDRLFGGNAGNQDPALAGRDLAGDFHHLARRFARAVNDFGKTFAQSAVRVHLGKTQVGQGRGLKRTQGARRAYFARAKIFQKLDGLDCCHAQGQYINVQAGHARKIGGKRRNRLFS